MSFNNYEDFMNQLMDSQNSNIKTYKDNSKYNYKNKKYDISRIKNNHCNMNGTYDTIKYNIMTTCNNSPVYHAHIKRY